MPDVYAVCEWDEERGFAIVADYPTALGWSDACAQPDADVRNGYDTVCLIGRLSDEQWTALQSDARYPAVLASGALTQPQLDALNARMATVMHPDLGRMIANSIDAEDAINTMIEANTRPIWRAGLSVTTGQVYYYDRNLWEVTINHITQSDWIPGEAVSLFKPYYETGTDPTPWHQPISSWDAYPINYRVTHNGKTWRSLIGANVWEPGSVGAEALWLDETPAPQTGEWVSGEQGLQIGDLRTYQGATYRVRQNPGINIWPPPTVPALWELVP